MSEEHWGDTFEPHVLQDMPELWAAFLRLLRTRQPTKLFVMAISATTDVLEDIFLYVLDPSRTARPDMPVSL
jgi:hypothetical protein